MSEGSSIPVLVIPGIYGSGPTHWQTRWQELHPQWVRVEQRSWDRPDRATWVATLEFAVAACRRPPILVAHSLGCALVAQWAGTTRLPVQSAFLVAPADVDSVDRTPDAVRSFAPMPTRTLPFPSMLVASTNDQYVSIERSRGFARAWGSDFVNLGAQGHINADSELDDWPAGLALLGQLIQDTDPAGADRSSAREDVRNRGEDDTMAESDGVLEKQPAEMTDDELQQAVQLLEVDLAKSQYGTRGHENAEAMLNAVMAEAERRAAAG